MSTDGRDPSADERAQEDVIQNRDDAPAPPGDAEADRASDGTARRPARDADGMMRPEFLLEFPVDERLDALIAAFERGDYGYVRDSAETLARETDRDDVRDAALELRRRVDPDPLARYVVVASILLLVFLVAWTYLGHDH
jgi:hypothetical protein